VTLAPLLLAKIREQVERASHLASLVPEGSLDWRPPALPAAFSLGVLLGHLLECLAGVCAVLHRLHPEGLAHFHELRARPVNHRCSPEEARQRMAEYLARIEEGFAHVTDEALGTLLPTAFVPEGEAVLTLLLGNLEHLVNHKHQLFTYLQQMGVPVATADLYVLRGRHGIRA
jgi:hypothetical protein